MIALGLRVRRLLVVAVVVLAAGAWWSGEARAQTAAC